MTRTRRPRKVRLAFEQTSLRIPLGDIELLRTMPSLMDLRVVGVWCTLCTGCVHQNHPKNAPTISSYHPCDGSHS